MPRRNSPVKPKEAPSKLGGKLLGRSQGAIDIHFHGAFGIDLMIAGTDELNDLRRKLWENGIAGFCPTTLSCEPGALLEAVGRLGNWIRSVSGGTGKSTGPKGGAVPIGIHLEGPFINSSCCGAHPPALIRPLDWSELDRLWSSSEQTLKILTIAPETLSREELQRLAGWAKTRRISLSLGHSKASENQASLAIEAGFRGITHAWNALSFHQRSPGALGAFLGKRAAYVELIIDQVHVAPTLIRWTQKLHPAGRLCFISDCVPAAATTDGKTYSFGPLSIQYARGACRLASGPSEGALAGGGKLLTRSFCEWLMTGQAASQGLSELKRALRMQLPSITQAPLWALQTDRARFARYQVQWRLDETGQPSVRPC